MSNLKLKGLWKFKGFKPEGCKDLPGCYKDELGFFLRSIDK